MGVEISICLESSQWEELELHLPIGVCTKLGRDEGFPMLDRRIVVSAVEYQTLVETARKYYLKLVRLIEKEKQLSSRSS
jgi:hypothetical protein